MQNRKIENLDRLIATARAVYPLQWAVWWLEGRDARDLVQRLSTNDVMSGGEQSAVWTVFVNEKARILNVVLVVIITPTNLLIVGDPAQREAFPRWIRRNVFIEDVRIKDETDQWNVIFVVHSTSEAYDSTGDLVAHYAQVAAAVGDDQVILPYFPFDGKTTTLWIVSRSSAQPWDGVEHLSEVAYHSGRIRQGIGTYGAEWISAFNPLEVGLRGMVSFDKGCYIGQEVIARIDSYGKLQRSLYGVRSTTPLTAGQPVVVAGQSVGTVTSAVLDSLTGRWEGLAVVRREIWGKAPSSVLSVTGDMQLVPLPMEEK